MTDRVNSLLVTLEHPMRDDDVEELISAIRCFRNVIDVSMNVDSYGDHVAKEMVKNELRRKLWGVLNE